MPGAAKKAFEMPQDESADPSLLHDAFGSFTSSSPSRLGCL